MKIQSKKGLSDIVTTVLIILLVAVAVAAVWSFVSPSLSGTGAQYTKTQVCISNILEPLSCTGSKGQYPADVKVRRTLSDGIVLLEEFEVIASTSGGSTPNTNLVRQPSSIATGSVIKDFLTGLVITDPVCDEGTQTTTCTITKSKTFDGTMNFKDLIIKNGGSIKHSNNGKNQENTLTIKATNVYVESGGSINVDGRGYSSMNGPGGGLAGQAWCSGGSGAGHGGKAQIMVVVVQGMGMGVRIK